MLKEIICCVIGLALITIAAGQDEEPVVLRAAQLSVPSLSRCRPYWWNWGWEKFRHPDYYNTVCFMPRIGSSGCTGNCGNSKQYLTRYYNIWSHTWATRTNTECDCCRITMRKVVRPWFICEVRSSTTNAHLGWKRHKPHYAVYYIRVVGCGCKPCRRWIWGLHSYVRSNTCDKDKDDDEAGETTVEETESIDLNDSSKYEEGTGTVAQVRESLEKECRSATESGEDNLTSADCTGILDPATAD